MGLNFKFKLKSRMIRMISQIFDSQRISTKNQGKPEDNQFKVVSSYEDIE